MDLTTIIRKLTTEQIERGMRWIEELDELTSSPARQRSWLCDEFCFLGYVAGRAAYHSVGLADKEEDALIVAAASEVQRCDRDLRQSCVTVLAERGAVPEPSFQTVP